MNPETFVYWLQGFVELQESDSISDKQWLVIKDHLKLVFDKQTPERSAQVYPDIHIRSYGGGGGFGKLTTDAVSSTYLDGARC